MTDEKSKNRRGSKPRTKPDLMKTLKGRRQAKRRTRSLPKRARKYITKPDPPMPFAIASFGSYNIATVKVKVDFNSQRKAYELFASTSDSTPAGNEDALLATSTNHPADGEFGAIMTYTPGSPLHVALKYRENGNPVTPRWYSYTAAEVVEGTADVKRALN